MSSGATSENQIPEARSAEIPSTLATANETTPTFKVYKPYAGSSSISSDLPDDYFEPTSSDLKLAQTQLSARTQALTNAPLQLRASREAAENAKKDRWPNTTIRIRFTDRTQLEKVFPSSDKIKSVYAFVRNSLREDVKPIKFILYQPPHRDLKVSDLNVKNLTLAQLELAPSSLLLLRFEEASLNGSHVPAPLAPDVLSLAETLPVPAEQDGSSASESSTKKHGNILNSGMAAGEKKIPKWLKLGSFGTVVQFWSTSRTGSFIFLFCT
ncbi:hypothetical protein BDP27DRAFT_1384011 [Rhodocollybia butyracea]|uniref:UBX domain-containing protein n=1 Tax=Rhodocollybia butyracea TaxID=206335 RepID=A0A9P5PK36_9AGAR|nr:hypothetical protein BDP27DRAFT_1384011 [Rhodocollybia butyracea]